MKSVDKQKGLTLIEMLVVVGIILILLVIGIPNFREGERIFALQRSAHKLAQDIRMAQEMAMSVKECQPVICGGTEPTIPSRYGIEFETDANSYILFADKNDNGKREPSDSVVETINLEQGVKIQQLFVDSIPKTSIWVTFKPPEPVIQIRDPGAGNFLVGEIDLTNDGNTQTITVNQAGLITVE